MPGRTVGRLFALAGFIALLFGTLELSGLRQNFSLGFLQQQILTNQLTGLMLFVLLFVLGNLIQVPGWIFLAAAVLTLGKNWGGMVTYVAACTSCISTFLIVRLIGGNALRELKNPLARRLFRQLDASPIQSVAVLRIFFQTVPALNYGLALSGIRFRHLLAGTLIGLPLPIALYCLLFDTLAKLFSGTPGGLPLP